MKSLANRLILLIVLAISIGLIGTKVAMAEGNEVGVGLMYSTISENDPKFDNAIGFGLSYARVVMPNVAVEVGLDYKKFDVKEGGASITTMPIRVTGKYLFSQAGVVRPWVGAGLGYYLNDVSLDDSDSVAGAIDDLNRTCDDAGLDCSFSGGSRSDLKNALGFHLGGGVDYLLSDNIALQLGIEYRIIKADAEFKTSLTCEGTDCDLLGGDPLSETSTDTVDLGGIDVKVGVKYMF